MKKIELMRLLENFPKTYYRLVDFEKLTGQSGITTSKTIERMIADNLLIRLSKDVYVRGDREFNLIKIAQELYSSYLSLESSLYQAGIINQPPFVTTLVSQKHSKKIKLGKMECEYSQLSADLWWGFELKEGIYQAEPEKAVVDMLYLQSRGKRRFQTDEWYLSGLDKKKLDRYLKKIALDFVINRTF